MKLRAVLALALASILAGCAVAPVSAPDLIPDPRVLPVATLAAIQANGGTLVGAGQCPSGAEVAVFAFEVADVPYTIWLAPSAHRFIIADIRNGDETLIWFGEVESGALVVRETMTYGEAMTREIRLCEWLDLVQKTSL